jgi:ribose transport system substrate-binding protein
VLAVSQLHPRTPLADFPEGPGELDNAVASPYHDLMEKFLRLVLPLLALALIVLMTVIVQELLRQGAPAEGEREQRDFHFALFLPDLDYFYSSEIESGAREAAAALGIGLSVFELNEGGGLRFAARSGFDGLAVFPPDGDPSMSSSLRAVGESGLPLVFIENEVPFDGTGYFVGSSSYDSGRGVGKIAEGIGADELELLLIYSKKNPGLLADARLVEMGLKEVLGARLSDLGARVTGLNPLDAEQMMYDLIRGDEIGNAVVLTDLNDTLMAAQAIIDLNLVGEIQLIGFGDNPTIRNYVDKGILLGSIVRNPRRVGFSAVMALHDLGTDGYTSAYVDTGVSILGPDGGVTPVRDYRSELP